MNNLNFRRQLRRNATAAEVILWQALRNKQIKFRKFRRQHPIGIYIVDFCCEEEKLVIELDGQSHKNVGTANADEIRDEWLSQEGYRVLRFENEEVYRNLERIVWSIEDCLSSSKGIPSS